jgi:hypothetical protein
MALGADSFSSENGTGALPENSRVECERASIDVFDVEIELLRPCDRVSAADLRQAGDARTDLMPSSMAVAV